MEIVAPLIGLDWTLIMILATFLVLYLVVKKFFFEKIHNFMQAREQKVKDQFDNADAVEKRAEEHLAEYEAKLDGIEIERHESLKEAKDIADRRAEQIIKEAKTRAEQIVAQAETQIERERAHFAETMRNQVAMLAIYAAEKIIEKQLDEGEHAALIDDIIKKDDNKAWTH